MNPKKFRGWCTNGCGNPIKIGATKYCSFKCQHDFNRKILTELLESGTYQVVQTTPFLRNYLVGRLGERCSRCGWSERHPTTGRVPVEVEHIDGDWRNNRVKNLTLLCPNCHALTQTFRGLNRGRGRPYRLGGRGNPINCDAPRPSTPKQALCKVLESPSRQLELSLRLPT
jgi:hypothetical protein